MNKSFIVLFLLASPYVRAERQVDFYTYGGFETIVDGFKRMGLMYSNQSFFAILFALVVLGILASLLKQIFGNVQTLSSGSGELKTPNPLSAFVPAFIGIVVIKALVLPTTTVHIYDRVKNDYEAVGGVPAFIAYIASGLNIIERSYIEEVVDTSSAFPYANNANGVSFKLLYDAIESAPSYIDAYDVINIKRYYEDCGVHALSTDVGGVTIQDIKSNTDDLSSLLADMKNSSVYTTMFSASNKSGVSYTCSQAYENVIKNFINDTAKQDSAISSLCEKNNFDVSKAVQKQACIERLEGAVSLIYKTGSAINANMYIRNSMIANAITQQITDDNPDGAIRALANQTMISNGLSTAIGSQEWYSSLKSMLTVIILGLAPILTLLIATPLITKAFPLMLSLFAFGTLWSLIDASMHQSTLDSMTRTMNDIKDHKLGLTAFWLTPTASVKALTVLSDARSSALSIAAMLASALFGLSAYGMSSVGQGTLGKVEAASNDASQDVTNPVNSATYLDQLANSRSVIDNVAVSGVDGLADSKSYELSSQIGGAKAAMSTTQGSAIAAGNTVGTMEGTQSGAEARTHQETGNLQQSVDQMATTQTQQSIGQSSGVQKAAADEGSTVSGMSEHSSYYNERKDYADISGKEDGAERLGVDLYENTREKSENQEITEYGETNANADNINFIKNAYSTGDDQFDTRFAAIREARLGDMGASDTIIATGGKVDEYTARNIDQIAGEIATYEGEQYVRDQEGTKIEQTKFMEGVAAEQKAVAESEVAMEKGYAAMNEGAKFDAYQDANTKIQGAEVAIQNGGIDSSTALNAEIKHSEEAAHSQNINDTAAAMGISNQELSSMRDISQNSEIAVTKEQAGDLFDKGAISKEQYTSFLDNDGGTLHGNITTQEVSNDLPLEMQVGLGMAGVTPVDNGDGTWTANDVTPFGAGMLFNQGHITDEQYQAIVSGDTDSVVFETGMRDEVKISDSKATSGESVAIDNRISDDASIETNRDNIYTAKTLHDESYTRNETTSVTAGIDTGNQTSTIDVITDGDKLFDVVSRVEGGDEEKARFVGIETTRALDGLFSANSNISNTETLGGGVNAGVGVDAKSGLANAGINGSYSVDKTDTDMIQMDAVMHTMSGAYLDLSSQADALNLEGQDKDRWVANKYADMSTLIMEQQEKTGKMLAQSGELDNTISMFFEDNNITKANNTIERKNDLGDIAKAGL